MNPNLKTTIKAWPWIAAVTMGVCFLTQGVAKIFGIDLPDQQNVDVVRQSMLNAFNSSRHLLNASLLVAQVIILLPAIEEFIFRYLITMLPIRGIKRKSIKDGTYTILTDKLAWAFAAVSSVLFSSAHYIAQPYPDSAFIALFLFGLAQCWLYFKTNSILCATINHALFNLTNLVLLLVLPQ